jgi:predicted CXXCH cytochrome family protein
VLGRRSIRLAVALVVYAGLLGLVGHHLWRSRRALTPPPGLESPHEGSPYRNTRPGVAYVGDQACRGCHEDISKLFQRHPMGQSLGSLAEVSPRESYDAAAHVTFTAQGFDYEVVRTGDKLIHRESRRDAQGKVISTREAEIRYVLGSGSRGRSYLLDVDGELFQSPIAWYSQSRRWDLSPGYDKKHYHFERSLKVECLFCHCNRVEPVPYTVGRYEQPVFRGHAIGCERCHGPGELHVREQNAGQAVADPNPSIVNPARLSPMLRDAVCEQCHLHGVERVPRRGREVFDFRPGLPLHDYLAVFVKRPEVTTEYRAVSQVEQMVASQCYRKSNGKLGCISCHDPHMLPEPAAKAAYYRKRCLECHGKDSPDCKLAEPVRQEKNHNDCAACHLPRFDSADVAHTAVTDHRVLARPDRPSSEPKAVALPPWQVPLVPFHERYLAPRDSLKRELGILLAQVSGNEQQPFALQQALTRLQESLLSWPEDVPVLKAKATALANQGRAAEALKTFEEILALVPRHEEALAWAGALAEQRGPLDRAEAYWRRAVEVNPHFSGYHLGLARVLLRRGQWDQAAREAETARAMDPTRLDVRRLLLFCYVKQGKRDKARAEWEAYQGFRPPDLEEVGKLLKGD